jgi:hypothetical protein
MGLASTIDDTTLSHAATDAEVESTTTALQTLVAQLRQRIVLLQKQLHAERKQHELEVQTILKSQHIEVRSTPYMYWILTSNLTAPNRKQSSRYALGRESAF